jgi:hypothetical protein
MVSLVPWEKIQTQRLETQTESLCPLFTNIRKWNGTVISVIYYERMWNETVLSVIYHEQKEKENS